MTLYPFYLIASSIEICLDFSSKKKQIPTLTCAAHENHFMEQIYDNFRGIPMYFKIGSAKCNAVYRGITMRHSTIKRSLSNIDRGTFIKFGLISRPRLRLQISLRNIIFDLVIENFDENKNLAYHAE